MNEQSLLKEKLGLSRSGIIQIPIENGIIGNPSLSFNAHEFFEAGSMLKMTIGAIAAAENKAVSPLIQEMIVNSSNEATERLVDIIGRQFIRQSMDQIGMVQSRLYDPESRTLSRTTPLEMAGFLTKLINGEIIRDQVLLARFKSLLKENKTKHEWLSLPSEVSFYGMPSIIRSKVRVLGKQMAHFAGWFEFNNSPENGGIVVVCNEALIGSINELSQTTSRLISNFVNSL